MTPHSFSRWFILAATITNFCALLLIADLVTDNRLGLSLHHVVSNASSDISQSNSLSKDQLVRQSSELMTMIHQSGLLIDRRVLVALSIFCLMSLMLLILTNASRWLSSQTSRGFASSGQTYERLAIDQTSSMIKESARRLRRLFSHNPSGGPRSNDVNRLPAKNIMNLYCQTKFLRKHLDEAYDQMKSVCEQIEIASKQNQSAVSSAAAARMLWNTTAQHVRSQVASVLNLEANNLRLASNCQQNLNFLKECQNVKNIVIKRTSDAKGEFAGFNQKSREGEGILHKVQDDVDTCKDDVEEAAKLVQLLSQRAEEIVNIIDVIDDIAEQTNLLALNASIEAARAGEQGQGFAVVAEEVRKLAARSSTATTSITDLLITIQKEAQQASEKLQEGNRSVTVANDSIGDFSKTYQLAIERNRHGQVLMADIALQLENLGIAFGSLHSSSSDISQVSKTIGSHLAEFKQIHNLATKEFTQLSVDNDRVSRQMQRLGIDLSYFEDSVSQTRDALASCKDFLAASESDATELRAQLRPRDEADYRKGSSPTSPEIERYVSLLNFSADTLDSINEIDDMERVHLKHHLEDLGTLNDSRTVQASQPAVESASEEKQPANDDEAFLTIDPFANSEHGAGIDPEEPSEDGKGQAS